MINSYKIVVLNKLKKYTHTHTQIITNFVSSYQLHQCNHNVSSYLFNHSLLIVCIPVPRMLIKKKFQKLKVILY